MTKYLIFHPGQPGIVWAEFSKNGDTENVILHNIIHAMKRGKFTEKGYALRCVPNIRNRFGSLVAKKADCVNLGELFVPKRNRGSNSGLSKITKENRFNGRDWESDRTTIESEVKDSVSISQIARRLGVTPSALSKANKRYKFYARKQQPCK